MIGRLIICSSQLPCRLTRVLDTVITTGYCEDLFMKLFDTVRKKIIALRTKPQEVRILVCGPTLYDLCHLGHARVLYFYDLMARYLAHKGFRPLTVVIVTDIDPKISAKAMRSGSSASAVSDRFMKELLRDMYLLEINRSLLLARVSNYIDTSISIMKRLFQEKFAYPASGNLYLDVKKISRYGEMSGISYEKLKDFRIDIAPNKHNPGDILLWNSSDFSCQQFFHPVVGKGIPWWHLQDSSVAVSVFDGRYDIHGGGMELIYPHHEVILGHLKALTNIAKPVGWWTHVGTVTIQGNKMSNSLSNTLKVRDLTREYSSNVVKLYLLSNHYRDELSFSRTFVRKYVAIDRLIAEAILSQKAQHPSSYGSKIFIRFQSHLDNDFDTPNALGVLLEGIANGIDKYILSQMIKIFGLHY